MCVLAIFPSAMQNRLEESLNLFQAICNNKFFVKTSMVGLAHTHTHTHAVGC